MKIEIRSLAKITPYEKNARKIPQRAVDKVAASLLEFGWQQPIVVDKKGVIVVGHTRWLAAGQLAWKTAPVHVADKLTPAQVKAYRLADNRTNEETSWNLELLAPELQSIAAMKFDLKATGFEIGELNKLMPVTAEEPEAQMDRAEELQGKWKVERGQVWLIGEHRLMCGDSRVTEEVDRLLRQKVHVVFTSPPYAEQREYGETAVGIPAQQYVNWYRPVAENIRGRLARDGSYFLNIKASCNGLDTDLYVFDLVLAHAREWGFHFATEFCWERNGVPKSVTQRFKNQFEPIYQFVLDRWKMRPDAVRHDSANVPTSGGPGSGNTSWAASQGGKGTRSVSGSFGAAKKRRNGTKKLISDVQGTAFDAGEYIGPGLAYPGNRLPTFAGSHQATGHVAAFPVGLAKFFTLAFTDERDSGYDPFCGSGSVMVAAQQLNRRCYGMEIEPKYCAVILERMTAMGLKPKLEKRFLPPIKNAEKEQRRKASIPTD